MTGSLGPPLPGVAAWDSATPSFNPAHGEVCVIFASLAQSDRVTRELEGLLSHEERVRARRFAFERDARRFVVARSFLRVILGQFLGVHPASLAFSYGLAGKPALEGRWAGALEFNLSHSDDGVLYAVAVGRSVGVDIEYIRPLTDAEEIAARILCGGEVAALAGLSSGERLRAFFEFWTRKEAFIKATGDGLAFPLSEIDVRLPKDRTSRPLSCAEGGGRKTMWTLHALMPHAAYAAALVVEGEHPRLTCRRWSPDERAG